MEPPKEIYLIRDAANPEGIFDTVASRKPMFQDDIPYIRKDALIEMLKGYSHPLTRIVVQELIDKINGL